MICGVVVSASDLRVQDQHTMAEHLNGWNLLKNNGPLRNKMQYSL